MDGSNEGELCEKISYLNKRYTITKTTYKRESIKLESWINIPKNLGSITTIQ